MRKFPFDKITQGRPLILGHRGARLEVAENTIASFLRALEEGADGVELDVRRTGDNRLVVFHDDVLPSGESLLDHTFEELKEISRANKSELQSYEEVLRELAGKGFLNIELKELGTAEMAVDLALDFLPPESYVFSSFLPTVVKECRRRAPDVPAIFITDTCRDPNKIFLIMENADASGIGLWHEALDEATARYCSTRQVPVFVWTVNDPVEARRFAELRVTGIITDQAALLRKALAVDGPEGT